MSTDTKNKGTKTKMINLREDQLDWLKEVVGAAVSMATENPHEAVTAAEVFKKLWGRTGVSGTRSGPVGHYVDRGTAASTTRRK